MKKILLLLLVLTMLPAANAFGSDIKVFKDNEELVLENKPVVVEGEIMLPIREVSEKLGCDVEWISDIKAVKISAKTDTEIYAVSAETVLYNTSESTACHFDLINASGNYVECFDFDLDTPSVIVDGTLYAPLDFFIFITISVPEIAEGNIYFISDVKKADFSQCDKTYVFEGDEKSEVTDEADIAALKEIFSTRMVLGASNGEYSSNGIEFITGDKSTKLYISGDTFNWFKVNGSDYYVEVSDDDILSFIDIADKYIS